MTHHPEPAIILVPDTPDYLTLAARCEAHARARGYPLVGLVRGYQHWPEVAAMAAAGQVAVVLVPSVHELPPDRVPRVESLTGEIPVPPEVAAAERGHPPRRLRRTRFIRR